MDKSQTYKEPIKASKLFDRTGAAAAPEAKAIGEEQLKKFNDILQKYKAGKSSLDRRIIAAEQWWKLRNWEQHKTEHQESDFSATSGWLHNVIVSKHADAMDAYPEPNILPREESDKSEATVLSSILPCVMEQNNFYSTYSDVQWQKPKYGTGAYKIVWDRGKLNGLGDIAIEKCNILNLFWEPGITDIQKSRYFFHTELVDKEIVEQLYPQISEKLKGDIFTQSKFLYDDNVDTTDKVTVIDLYYKTFFGGKKILHYCKYVGTTVIYATENDITMPTKQVPDPVTGQVYEIATGKSKAETGWYDHGLYPYVFDALFPVEGSPCGYGYIDTCLSAQEQIDLMGKAIVDNTLWTSTSRYFARQDGSVNESEFGDTRKKIVHVNGNLGDDALKQIIVSPLSGTYVEVLKNKIEELRQTSGNTEASTGNPTSGVTAASAIAALQEASGKGSRDSTRTSYNAYTQVVNLCIELIRQFYEMPRKFRIIGQRGAEQYITYSNNNLKMQSQGEAFGQDMGFRLPVFDIKISAQKASPYQKLAQNELALQFFDKGFFNPQLTDQALMCLDMMDFDGKDAMMQKVSQNGTMAQKLIMFQQLALSLAAKYEPQMAEGLSQQIMQGAGMQRTPSGGDTSAEFAGNIGNEEHANVEKSRSRSQNASQPDGGEVISTRRTGK